MTESPDDLPRPPERPEAAMCCGRGCCPCIFDYYDDAFARWQALVRERGFDPAEVTQRRD
ncbi:oxidoreductase-like domain-containing protein [Sphingomonas chungangi]|uniref:oxidoreductase-like domain-containing protein n=1 Tax=Sphingomonas chungangi TaxID=2683589 RepID=UPI001C66EE69